MNTLQIESFNIIGISVRTTNQNGQAGKDIVALWNKFISEGIAQKIPGRVDESIYSVYTHYESDHTKPYDTILGCRVSSLKHVPEGLVGLSVEGGMYAEIISKGDLNKGAVYTTWLKIWEMDLLRAYTADFEVYGEKAANPADAEVSVFIALKR